MEVKVKVTRSRYAYPAAILYFWSRQHTPLHLRHDVVDVDPKRLEVLVVVEIGSPDLQRTSQNKHCQSQIALAQRNLTPLQMCNMVNRAGLWNW